MPVPIQDYTIKIIWENNPDTPITSSALSKDFDAMATYLDFDFPSPPPHAEGTFILPDNTDQLRLIMKRGSMFQIINRAEDPPGTPIIPVNSQYRVFDVGLEDLYLTINDMDDTPGNPVSNWGPSNEWFVYICDKDDSTVYQESSPDQYGGGAQILISRSRVHPVGQVPGRVNPVHVNYGLSSNYSDKDTRMIGGFKSDSLGNIVPESVWDISGKFHTVRAKHYWVLDEFGIGPDNNRYIYRQLELKDLNTTVDNEFEGDLIVHGNITQDSGNSSFTGNVQIDGDFDLESSSILMDGSISIGSRTSSNISHVGDFLNNSTNFEINTASLDIEAITNIITETPQWINIGNFETTGNSLFHGNVTQNMGDISITGDITSTSTSISLTSTNFDTHGVWDHYGDFSIHSTVNIGESGDPATIIIYSSLDHFGDTDFDGAFTQVGGNFDVGTVGNPTTTSFHGPFTQDTGAFIVNGSTMTINSGNVYSDSTWNHIGSFTINGSLQQSGGDFDLSGDVNIDSYLQVGRTSGTPSIISVKSVATDYSSIRSEADSGGLSYLYVGQDGLAEGGGIMFRGSPSAQQFLTTNIANKTVFYRTQESNNLHYAVFHYPENSNTVTFEGDIVAPSITVNGSMTVSGNAQLNGGATLGASDSITFTTGGDTLSGSTNVASSGGTGIVQTGYFAADRVYNAVWNDLAEYFLTDEKIELPGRVYAIYGDDQKVELAKFRACTRVVGLCSDSAAYVMKSEYKEKGAVLIAMSGTVKAWVKEVINPGDLLVTDKDGYISKARWYEKLFNPHSIVAKAIEGSKDNNAKRILVLVK